ncbi:nucleotide exchange factor GrpE [Actinomadura terrae]|uniref:nucleotide exchange factor GrpE n=1 Tax=Actinomadura terrae TaxID=604353 RepID=UPI001FA80ADC|nr:nucleotide exchange factor GrpE [Actinomadura terrae]
MSTDGERPVNDGSGAEVAEALAALSAQLSARLDREHERAAHREAVIDRLHEENQRLRRGELEAMLEPARAALYRLHDQARRESRRLSESEDPPDPARTAQLLAAVADDVADALARLGVERYTVEPGAPYDPSRHRPVAVTSVAEPARDGTVVTVQSDGFEREGAILRKAAVCVGRLDPATPGAPSSAAPGAPSGAASGATPGATAPVRTGRDMTEPNKTGSSRPRAAGRGATMSTERNTGLGTD